MRTMALGKGHPQVGAWLGGACMLVLQTSNCRHNCELGVVLDCGTSCTQTKLHCRQCGCDVPSPCLLLCVVTWLQVFSPCEDAALQLAGLCDMGAAGHTGACRSLGCCSWQLVDGVHRQLQVGASGPVKFDSAWQKHVHAQQLPYVSVLGRCAC